MARMRPIATVAAAFVLVLGTAGSCAEAPQDNKNAPYRDAARPVGERVEDLLKRMSLDDKIGQMTQAERGSISPSDVTEFRIGSVLSGGGSVPKPNDKTGWNSMINAYQEAARKTPLGIPFIYGADAVHGHNNVAGATVFPHNVGLGATRDADLLNAIGKATAEEVKETGVHWTFAPCVCVSRDERWGRAYESYSEDPAIVARLGAALIDGLQGQGIMATAKHYLGDGGTANGKDQGDTVLTSERLRAIHLPPYIEAIKHNVASVMVSFSSWNGEKVHGNEYLISKLLKEELGFKGFVVSDWNGMDQIDGSNGLSAADVRTAINAGIDMAMVPTAWGEFIRLLREEVNAGRVTQQRIDDANRRILTKKFEYGLFEAKAAQTSADHRALARQAVAKSQVVLKNSGILPLKPGKLFVAGKNADNTGNQSGGWTLTWQGDPGVVPGATSILKGIRDTAGPQATVTFAADGTGIDSSYNAVIAVIGEKPYAEFEGDRPEGVKLDAEDQALLTKLRASGVPIVVVLVSGRPMEIGSHLADWDALVAAWLPGSEGAGVADVLFGQTKPTGKLPVSWPVDGGLPVNSGDGKPTLFPLGAGLTS
jgi:beta-glucosidase